MKQAEDGGRTIIRLYELFNRRTKATVVFHSDISRVFECDMLENNIDSVDVSGKAFMFIINPFEIKTFRVKLGK